MAADPLEARIWLTDALRCWPGHPEAVALDAELNQHEAKIRTLVDKVMQAARARTFENAGRLLEELASLAPTHPQFAILRKQVDEVLADARRQVGEGRKHQAAGRNDSAVECYGLALGACVDCQAARDEFARCPPARPPTSLSSFVLRASR